LTPECDQWTEKLSVEQVAGRLPGLNQIATTASMISTLGHWTAADLAARSRRQFLYYAIVPNSPAPAKFGSWPDLLPA
jgi:hypothetical protein